MKYPYIGKGSRSGAVFLFLCEGEGLVLDQGFSSLTGKQSGIVETLCRNITAEYLANTYGEVKSKEHAEFIVKLCKGTEIDTTTMGGYNPKLPFFNIYKEGDVMYLAFWGKESACITEGEKQITIPLPPECEGVDEWPVVGDDVVTNMDEDDFIDDGELGVVLTDKYKGEFCVKLKTGLAVLDRSQFRKPKTPEQELREFLHLLWRENNEDFDDFADIAILHLKKKGEGDGLQ